MTVPAAIGSLTYLSAACAGLFHRLFIEALHTNHASVVVVEIRLTLEAPVGISLLVTVLSSARSMNDAPFALAVGARMPAGTFVVEQVAIREPVTSLESVLTAEVFAPLATLRTNRAVLFTAIAGTAKKVWEVGSHNLPGVI